MKTEIEIQKASLTARLNEIIRNEDDLTRDNCLKIIVENLDWGEIMDIITEGIDSKTLSKYEEHDLYAITKCLVLGEILEISDFILPFQISETKVYKDFTGLNSFNEIPKIKTLISFRNCLIENKIFDIILDAFYMQLAKPEINFQENESQDSSDVSGDSYPDDNYRKTEDKIREIEEKIKTLYDKKLSLNLAGINEEKADALSTKLVELNLQIVRLTNGNLSSESKEYQYLLSVEKSIDRIRNLAGGLEGKVITESDEKNSGDDGKEKLHMQLFDTFFEKVEEKQKDEARSLEKERTEKERTEPERKSKNGNKLKYADKILNELTESSNTLNIISSFKKKQVESENINTVVTGDKEMPGKFELKSHPAILLNPGTKKDGIFNDENLTEDYEIGFRFHRLGLKTGFFNIMLDSNNESTRIATAEFFPNTFWSTVKQRSRWIAGICLQNWKANKWYGNLSTRYFLFRDRKPLFSLPGAFLSNVLFLYLVYSISCEIFGFKSPMPLVNQESALWYLMITILVFMVSRITHRFIFTYNWYGFRFAASSIIRSLLDTVINFFAVLRALKVFRQTKKKIVWDVTSHY